MRIRSFYLTEHFTLSLARRIVGPLSTLTHRGQDTGYGLLTYPGALTTRDDTITILPDWSLSSPLHTREGLLVYDLSDAKLLKEDGVRAVMGQCHVTLVPNEQTAALARAFAPKVVVAPSMVFNIWLLGQKVYAPEQPVVLLAGPEASCLKMVEPLRRYLKGHPSIRLMTNHQSVVEALQGTRPEQILLADYEPVQYPVFLRSAFLVLLAGEDTTLDTIPAYEAAFLGACVVAGPGYASAHDVAHIVTSGKLDVLLNRLTDDDRYRTNSTQEFHQVAKKTTVTQHVDSWRQILEKSWRNHVRVG